MNNISWFAYEMGRQACEEANGDTNKAKNPYMEGSVPWKSWNRGWNSVGMDNREGGGK